MPFQPGHSGNPAGRPRGARNKTSVLVEQLLEGDAEAIMRRIIDQAKAGNPRTLSLLAPALLPKRKDAFIELDLPPLEQASDAPGAIAAIVRAVCTSEVTPQEGTSLTRMVEAYVRAKQNAGGLRPEREKADAVAAAMQEAVEPHMAHEREAPSPVRAVNEPDAPIPPEHDPEKACPRALTRGWEPVFGKRSCSTKNLEREDDSKKSHPAPREPGVNAPAPEAWRAVFAAAGSRSLPRLREQALRSTSPLAQSATRRAAIVSPLLSPDASAAAPDPMRAAA